MGEFLGRFRDRRRKESVPKSIPSDFIADLKQGDDHPVVQRLQTNTRIELFREGETSVTFVLYDSTETATLEVISGKSRVNHRWDKSGLTVTQSAFANEKKRQLVPGVQVSEDLKTITGDFGRINFAGDMHNTRTKPADVLVAS